MWIYTQKNKLREDIQKLITKASIKLIFLTRNLTKMKEINIINCLFNEFKNE